MISAPFTRYTQKYKPELWKKILPFNIL